jgi:hypothetical protein
MESSPPVISVVVVIVSDTMGHGDVFHLTGSLRALAEQVNPPAMEIIVPHYPGVGGLEELRREHPKTRFLEVSDLKAHRAGSREHHDELRARGMAIARGRIIALLEDHGIVDGHWSTRVVEAHRSKRAGIGGAIENGINRSLNWAVYFCDFLRYQNPLPSGESTFASDANVSYKREALEAIRPVWEKIFHETKVNWELRSRGETLALAPEVVVYQHRHGLRLMAALQERFVWGRSYAATRGAMAGSVRRFLWAAFSPLLPLLLLSRMTLSVLKKGRNVGAFVKALPLTATLLTSWSWGELAGYLTGRANRVRPPAVLAMSDSSAAGN